MTIGQRMREKRREKGLTLKQLADMTGLSVTYLSDVERERTQPSLKTLGVVAQGLGLSTTDLMAGVEALGDATVLSLPAGLRELCEDLAWKDQLSEDWQKTLLKLDYRGQRPQTKQEWRDVFISLRSVLAPDEDV